ncbi:heparinase [Psychromonas sp. B3M02]|uniref:alginate lyase family protein n=1 Tax=Psychromonas sp. B3M02 TaxID=2267226 RepID=UPI000DEA2E48|nr:alginate lyase family protein [Psychromonas sp. B3M02]RBW47812.1 heparinase [Psychromonas sp. B3M02]
MQTVTWYIKRIQMMSLSEITWRIISLSAAWVERIRVQFNWVSKAEFVKGYQSGSDFNPGFTVFTGQLSAYNTEWKAPLLAKAEMVMANKLSYFDLHNKHLETPINWHKDHSANIYANTGHILDVNYRDFKVNGDCKLVWEPNRHHQMVVLARAYQVTGDIQYAQAAVAQMTHWLDQNPYGKGMNWRSPLELAIRLINWVWTIDLIKESGLFVGDFKARLLESVFLHCRDVSSKFSQGTSANNHLVGEAAGVYIAASYFSMLRDAATWKDTSKQILEREMVAQTFDDGCTKEHAFSYQFFVLQFYLVTGLTGKWSDDDFSDRYWKTLKSLSQFVVRIAEGGEHYPMLGDQDDGYVLDLGDHVHDINALTDVMGHFYDDPLFASPQIKSSESSFWLFNNRQAKINRGVVVDSALNSIAFEDAGYYLLQAGKVSDNNQASILMDVAELGYTAIAAHGHADALSCVVRINQHDLFVDTGTYDYFSFPEWRNHFRKTQAHNTLEVDGLDQSVMTGPFMWESHAQSTCIEWSPSKSGGKIVAAHDGYQRLPSPVTHQRDIELDITQQQIVITDYVKATAQHDIAIYFHLSEACQDIRLDQGSCYITLGDNEVVISLPEQVKATLVQGVPSDDKQTPSLGWLSRGYHQKVPITTLVLSADINGNSEFVTSIAWK